MVTYDFITGTLNKSAYVFRYSAVRLFKVLVRLEIKFVKTSKTLSDVRLTR